MALENKLSAVHHLGLIVRSSMSQLGDPVYVSDHVEEYDAQGGIIAATEAYFAAIYSVLEITSLVNRSLHPGLPIGFRRQAKKWPTFDFGRHRWLPLFYDLRTELVHFGTPHVDPKNLALIIEFTANKLEHFKQKRYTIPMVTILKFAKGLFEMLDTWALEELKSAKADAQVHTMFEETPGTALRIEKTPVSEILTLVDAWVAVHPQPASATVVALDAADSATSDQQDNQTPS
jgi:hypothetical protein